MFNQYENEEKPKNYIQSTLEKAISLAEKKKAEEITEYLKCVDKGKGLFFTVLDCNNNKSVECKVNALLKEYEGKKLDANDIKSILKRAKKLAEDIVVDQNQRTKEKTKEQIIKYLEDASKKLSAVSSASKTQEVEINDEQSANNLNDEKKLDLANDVSGGSIVDEQANSPQSSVEVIDEGTEASANAAVTIPEKVDSLVSDKDVTDGSDNELLKFLHLPKDNTHSPQSIRVRDSFGYTPLKVAHERNITVKTRNAQNLQSAVLSSQQLASRNVIKIFNKHGREDFTPLKLMTPVAD